MTRPLTPRFGVLCRSLSWFAARGVIVERVLQHRDREHHQRKSMTNVPMRLSTVSKPAPHR